MKKFHLNETVYVRQSETRFDKYTVVKYSHSKDKYLCRRGRVTRLFRPSTLISQAEYDSIQRQRSKVAYLGLSYGMNNAEKPISIEEMIDRIGPSKYQKMGLGKRVLSSELPSGSMQWNPEKGLLVKKGEGKWVSVDPDPTDADIQGFKNALKDMEKRMSEMCAPVAKLMPFEELEKRICEYLKDIKIATQEEAEEGAEPFVKRLMKEPEMFEATLGGVDPRISIERLKDMIVKATRLGTSIDFHGDGSITFKCGTQEELNRLIGHCIKSEKGLIQEWEDARLKALANLKSEIDHVVSTKSKYLTVQFNCAHFTDNVERYKIFMTNKVKSRNDGIMMIRFEADMCMFTIDTNLFSPYDILSFLHIEGERPVDPYLKMFGVKTLHETQPIDAEAIRAALDQAERHNDGKLQWSLIDFKSLEEMVKVLGFGAEKYSPDNWKRGLPTSKIFESLMRHLTALQAGEEIDPESKLHHTGHILCNAMFLAYMYQSKREFVR